MSKVSELVSDLRRLPVIPGSWVGSAIAKAVAMIEALSKERDEAWESGMREAAQIASQSFEHDPEYCVYLDGPEIAAEIRAAIRARTALSPLDGEA